MTCIKRGTTYKKADPACGNCSGCERFGPLLCWPGLVLAFDIHRYKGQDELLVSHSPTMACTLTAYKNHGGNSGYAIVCTVKDNATGETRNICFDGDATEAKIQWLDHETVPISTIALNVNDDTCDYRLEKAPARWLNDFPRKSHAFAGVFYRISSRALRNRSR